MLLMVYNSLILPYLMYCTEIWGNTYEHRIRDLVLLQKRAVRIIDFHTSHAPKNYKKAFQLLHVELIYRKISKE